MTAIKFRGKDNIDGEWVFGHLVDSCYGLMILTHPLYHVDCAEWNITGHEVTPETVGQFTGITDKNGVEIFGDDLRKDELDNIFRIYHVSGGFAIKANYWMKDLSDWTIYDDLIIMPLSEPQTRQWIEQSTKHFGNIHETPQP